MAKPPVHVLAAVGISLVFHFVVIAAIFLTRGFGPDRLPEATPFSIFVAKISAEGSTSPNADKAAHSTHLALPPDYSGQTGKAAVSNSNSSLQPTGSGQTSVPRDIDPQPLSATQQQATSPSVALPTGDSSIRPDSQEIQSPTQSRSQQTEDSVDAVEARSVPNSGGSAPSAPPIIPVNLAAQATHMLLSWVQDHKNYPAAARRRGIEGRVELRVLIAPAGQLTSISIEHSSGSNLLDQAARDLIAQASPLIWPFSTGSECSVWIDYHLEQNR